MQTEEILTGSEGRPTSLQYIPEEIPAATVDETAQQDLTVDVANTSPRHKVSVPSADTNTVPTATAEEIAKSQAVTNPNDSNGSTRHVFDVRPKKTNLQLIPIYYAQDRQNP